MTRDDLVPALDCDWPCRSCMSPVRDNCRSCWVQVWSDNKYYFLDTGLDQGGCNVSCPKGYTRDNSESYVCIRCADSCAECKDEDRTHCTKCNASFPYTLSGTGTCLEDCSFGYYQTQTSLTCATCEAPCADCFGEAKTCTFCDTKSKFPVLFESRCIEFCPPGYTSVNGKCEKCVSPCATCIN